MSQRVEALLILNLLHAAALRAKDQKSTEKEPDGKDDESQRGTGRTTNLALEFTRKALDAGASETGVEIIDHHNTPENNVSLANKVSKLLRALEVSHEISGNIIEVVPLVKNNLLIKFGELPEWAVAYNETQSLVPGAQLLTKDGRQIGNASVAHTHDNGITWCIITEAGDSMRMLTADIEKLFFVGNFIEDPAKANERYAAGN